MALVIGLLIPLLGTMLGAAFVFLMKDEMSPRLQKSLLGFASGVMVAASVWSLLIPAMEMEADAGKWSVVPAAVGFLLGIGFLLLLDELTPHLHIGTETPEGPHSHLSRTAMLALAVTVHVDQGTLIFIGEMPPFALSFQLFNQVCLIELLRVIGDFYLRCGF